MICLNSQLGVEMMSVKFAAEETVVNASILINATSVVFNIFVNNL